MDLLELVEQSGVVLQQSGDKWKGRCPFHDDKTSSFFVFPDNTYFCFGACGEGGSAFTYINKHPSLKHLRGKMVQDGYSIGKLKDKLSQAVVPKLDWRERSFVVWSSTFDLLSKIRNRCEKWERVLLMVYGPITEKNFEQLPKWWGDLQLMPQLCRAFAMQTDDTYVRLNLRSTCERLRDIYRDVETWWEYVSKFSL